MSNPTDPNQEQPQYAPPVQQSEPQPYGAPVAQQPVQPQQHAAPAATQQYAAAPQAPTNVLAIVSLVTSIIGLSLVGVILGHIAMSQIKRTGESGRGLALAGLIIGYIFLALTVIVFAIYAVFVIAALSYSSY